MFSSCLFLSLMYDCPFVIGTASRWIPRIVCPVSVKQPDCKPLPFGVSAAFAECMAFEDLSKLIGTQLCSVQIVLRGVDMRLLRQSPVVQSVVAEGRPMALSTRLFELR